MSDEVVDVGTGLVTGKDLVGSPQQAGLANQIFAEMQAAVLMAKHYPRNFNKAWAKMQEMCQRKTLALKAEYKYPRGKKQIAGPSVYIARPIAMCWGNLHYGFKIINETEDALTIQGWAWDLESGSRIMVDMTVKKLIFRKDEKGVGRWVKPDERDLQELINRIGAKQVRNAILQIVPTDFTEDAVAACRKTLTAGLKDPKSAVKNLIRAFQEYNVSIDSLNRYIESEEWTSDNIVDLQGVLNAINDGEAKPSAYFSTKPQVKTRKKTTIKKMKAGDSKNHQSVKGKVDKKKPEPKKEEPPEVEPSEPEILTAMGTQINEILGLVKENEAVMSGSLLKKCLKSNLEGMSPDGLRVVRIDVDEAITEAEKIAAAAK